MTRSVALSYDEDFFAWTQEQAAALRRLPEAFSPAMRRAIDMDRVWRQGKRRAEATLRKMGATMSAPPTCPFTLDELLDEAFDVESALDRLARAGR